MNRLLVRSLPPVGLLAVVLAVLVAGGSAAGADDRGVAGQILGDARLASVLSLARDVLRDDLTAGESYREVWIRDLNTFITVSSEVNGRERLRRALLTFCAFQGEDGNIPDGYVPADQVRGYAYRASPSARGFLAHKNTAETDQESSLVQAVAKYVVATGDPSILDEVVAGTTVRDRLARALAYVRDARMDARYGLVWGGTTADWGDLQPEHPGATDLDATSHRAIDVYDNAMFVIAIDDYVSLVGTGAPDAASWIVTRDAISRRVRASLWDTGRRQFIPHLYLDPTGSPFPVSFDERAIYVHGGTATAIEAGFLARAETMEALDRMRSDVRAAGAGSIGLALYPPYPDGAFASRGMGPFNYQNGGDWDWFGGRMVQQLVKQGFAADAYRELTPMVVRIQRAGDFAEWWTRANQPRGAGHFRGAAGVVGQAIEMLEAWASAHQASPPSRPSGR